MQIPKPARDSDPLGLDRALGIFLFRRGAQTMMCALFLELVL